MTAKPAPRYVAYYRVSTAKQGASGLGLEAQMAAVRQFVGCTDCIIDPPYIEVESGKRNDRPQLAAAIEAAKRHGAKLVVAKLDRLSRNAVFLLTLKEAGVDFQACDVPELNTLTLGVFASVAQFERERISERTKAALQAKIAQGHSLGVAGAANLAKSNAAQKGADARKHAAKTNEHNVRAAAMAQALKSSGKTLRGIADALNTAGFKTSRGGLWGASSVLALLKRQD